MRLSNLIENLNLDVFNFRDVDIRYVTDDSRDVKASSLFFAVSGEKFDGHGFVNEAIKNGTVAVISDDRQKAILLSKKFKVPIFLSRNIRKIESEVSARFYGNPSKNLCLIGITGTNGKTTTSYILYELLKSLGKKVALTGTVEYKTDLWSELADRTTPLPIKYNRLLSRFRDEGIEFVVSEVSSQAVDLNRIDNVDFSYGIFTNLSPEHLDFHKDMYRYFISKRNFFNKVKDGISVNVDNEFGKVLWGIKGILPAKRAISFGMDADLSIESVLDKGNLTEIRFSYNSTIFIVDTNLKGVYNAYNLAAAISVLLNMGFSSKDIDGITLNVNVPGRLEEVASGVFVDYAHTPNALENVLKTAKNFTKGKLIVVFGCGGNRDRLKRPIMGKIADNLADITIVTSDNPRDEDPIKITKEITRSVEKPIVIVDRSKAIRKALSIKTPMDTVIIAGKGHENYQIVKGKRFPFSDRKVVEEFYEFAKDS